MSANNNQAGKLKRAGREIFEKAKGRPQSKKEIGKNYVDRIEKSRKFEPLDKPQIGARYWLPKQRGESIRGVISNPIQNIRRQSSYPIVLESGEIIEVFGNKQLHTLINKSDVMHQLVEIEYRGRQFTYAGHYRRIFRLHKIDYEGNQK